MSALIRHIATLGPIGFAPVAPATVASLVVTIVIFYSSQISGFVHLALTIPFAVLAVWASGDAEKTLGHDARPIVIDELAGQWLTFSFIPHTHYEFLAGFLLFRLFDIWKPLGARQAQKLPGGYGIVADDLIAGAAACITLHLLMWGMKEMGWALG